MFHDQYLYFLYYFITLKLYGLTAYKVLKDLRPTSKNFFNKTQRRLITIDCCCASRQKQKTC